MEAMADSSKRIWNDVRKRIETLFGIGSNPYMPILQQVLLDIVDQEGRGILLEPPNLRKALSNRGVEECDILKLLSMINVSGFSKLLARNSAYVNANFNQFVASAMSETGLKQSVVLDLAYILAVALGITVELNEGARFAAEDYNAAELSQQVSIYPLSVYNDALKDFQIAFEDVTINNTKIDLVLDFEVLEPLISIGFPKAKYYYGFCLLHGIQLSPNKEKGIKLLKEAADNGDSEAAAALGDYYMQNSEGKNARAAYSFYAGYGAPALDPPRREALFYLLQRKSWNKQNLHFTWLFFGLSSIITILLAELSTSFFLTGSDIALIVVEILVQAFLCALAWLYFRKNPFGNVLYFNLLAFIFWMIFIACIL